MRIITVFDKEYKIGELIKQLRLAKGYSIRQLASMTMYSPSTISRWETGSRTPSLEVFTKIVMALDHEVIVIKKRRGDEANRASKEV